MHLLTSTGGNNKLGAAFMRPFNIPLQERYKLSHTIPIVIIPTKKDAKNLDPYFEELFTDLR